MRANSGIPPGDGFGMALGLMAKSLKEWRE